MKILILTGGASPERSVALRSADAVARALTESGQSVAVLDILRPIKQKELVFYTDYTDLKSALSQSLKSNKDVARELHTDIFRAVKEADAVFLALHGGIGENGTVQGMLDAFGVRYSGSSMLACATAMDKLSTKNVYLQCGINTPQYTFYKKDDVKAPIPPKYPCVVKPANGGSSIGVSFVYSPSALKIAVETALKDSDTVLMEERIVGRELSVSVLNDKALAVTEIIPKNSFYDYESKYKLGASGEITPAPLSKDIYGRAMRIAENAHKALKMRNFSRTDLILSEECGEIFALETNALPGMTETSILPQAALFCGINMSDLCLKMLL